MMRKSFLMAFGIVALCAMVLYQTEDTFAASKKPRVISSKRKPNRDCGKSNRFRWFEEVRVKGKRFDPLDNVDIYVIANKKWEMGDRFGPLNPSDPQDVSTDGPETVATDSNGEIPCTRIWPQPLPDTEYDIVVDANQDGTYNDGDAIDGRKRKPGFRVR